MNFLEIVNDVKMKEKGKIRIFRLGTFYVVIGIDAYILNELLDLKITKFSNDIVKCGFPVNALNKYLSKLNECKIAYSLFDSYEEVCLSEQFFEYNGLKYVKIYENLENFDIDRLYLNCDFSKIENFLDIEFLKFDKVVYLQKLALIEDILRIHISRVRENYE